MTKSMTPNQYAAEYEFRGDGGDYTPTDGERTMIEDAILGYLGQFDEPSSAERSAVGVKKTLPSQGSLHAMFEYDGQTGNLYRKPLSAHAFLDTTDKRGPQWVANNYNSQNAGKEAFTYADKRGYRHGTIFGVNYQAHRVIWKMMTGEDPDTIDHINGDTSDNRFENLRSCTVAENSRNYAKPSGSSKYRGVCWVKRDQAWAARISNGKGGKVSLGNYKDEIEAARAYDKAAREMHGEFALLNFPDEV